MRRWAPLLLLAACGDSPAPPPVTATTAAAPAAVVTRFDGAWSGTATRSLGRDAECGPVSRPARMDVVRGRATGTLPGGLGQSASEGAGTVTADGSLVLRSRLDAALRAEGSFGERSFTARFVTRACAWTITLNRVG